MVFFVYDCRKIYKLHFQNIKLFIKPLFIMESHEMKIRKFYSRQLWRDQMRGLLSKTISFIFLLRAFGSSTTSLPSWGVRNLVESSLQGRILLEYYMQKRKEIINTTPKTDLWPHKCFIIACNKFTIVLHLF